MIGFDGEAKPLKCARNANDTIGENQKLNKTMCKPISAIVQKDGTILHNPWTDSHEDLVRIFKLNDTSTPRGEPRFARIEFCPDDTKDMDDLSKYKLNIDEQRCPEWFDDKMKKSVIEKMTIIVSGMIIKGKADILCGGVYILAKGAKISCIKNTRIIVMCESSNVGVMRESSNVGVMWESSKVGEMWGSSNVGEMRESSNVGVMRESSNVGEMRESSNVGEMWGSSNVGVMRESSNVGVMWESSNVGVMRESSKVEKNNTIKKETKP